MFKKIMVLVLTMVFSLLFLECGTRVLLKDKIDSKILRSKFFNVGAIPSDDQELVYELKEGLTYTQHHLSNLPLLGIPPLTDGDQLKK